MFELTGLLSKYEAKKSGNSNMKQGGACIATMGDEAFRLMLFMCSIHVVRPILVHDSHMLRKSTFLNFFDNFVQNSFENAEQISISEGKKVENSKEIFLFKIHSKRYENVFEGLRDHQIHKTSNLP